MYQEKREAPAISQSFAIAQIEKWPIKEPPRQRCFAPDYYDCVLAVPDAEGVEVVIAHAWDDLPAKADAPAPTVRIAGADPNISGTKS